MEIAVIGAGIAGMSSAIALTQAGHAVTLHERRPDPHGAGGGMVLWPNASFVLDQLGLLPAVAAAGGVPSAMRRLTQAGAPLQSLDIGRLDRQMGYPSIAIFRRELVRILLQWLTGHGVPVHFDVAELSLQTGADGCAWLQRADGSAIEADLILGADGRMHSITRQFVLGTNEPRFQGFVNWVGAVKAEHDLVERPEVQDFWGKGERFGVVAVTTRDVYWAAAAVAPSVSQLPPFEALYSRFAHWPAPIPELLRQTRPDQVRLIPVHDVDPTERWHRANVLMIGDAAHGSLPTSGQGAAQALEDAWHLPRCLAAHEGMLDDALTAFTATRAPKANVLTLGARQFARSLFHTDDGESLARDVSAKNVDAGAQVAGMARGWGAGLPMDLARSHAD